MWVRYHITPMEKLYQRVYDRSKVKMKGYDAVQRKLLCLFYALWKNDTAYNPTHIEKMTSGIQEPKPLFSVGQIGPKKKVANEKSSATLDGLLCIQSHEALFSVPVEKAIAGLFQVPSIAGLYLLLAL